MLPTEQKLIAYIHKRGARTKLHICGNATPLLPYLTKTNSDIIDIDHLVDLGQAVEVLGDGQYVSGNFDPVSILLQGTTDDVRKAVAHCMKIGKDKLFVSAGCEVPKFTPPENLKAVEEALWANSSSFM